MAIIRVTAAQLKTGAEELRNLNQQFKAAVSDLESTEGSLNSMWEGEARNAFHQAFTNDKTQMDNFFNALKCMPSAWKRLPPSMNRRRHRTPKLPLPVRTTDPGTTQPESTKLNHTKENLQWKAF